MRVLRAAERYRIGGPGWEGWCCFSYDQHYDPDNVSFGRVLACNELLLQPGAGFGLHRHAGYDVVTTVLEGVLTHVGDGGSEQRGPGSYRTPTGPGFAHDERNDGDVPVRFVQVFLDPDGGAELPERLVLAAGDEVVTGSWVHLLVLDGAPQAGGVLLRAGDSARLEAPALLAGPGVLLLWRC